MVTVGRTVSRLLDMKVRSASAPVSMRTICEKNLSSSCAFFLLKLPPPASPCTTCTNYRLFSFCFAIFWRSSRLESLSLFGHQQVPESDKEPEMPPYISFLTGAYKSECRAWEIERLVRKMLLSLLTSAIPVSYSPAFQMLVVSSILVVSMGLHHYFMPYKVSWTVSLNVPSPSVLCAQTC